MHCSSKILVQPTSQAAMAIAISVRPDKFVSIATYAYKFIWPKLRGYPDQISRSESTLKSVGF